MSFNDLLLEDIVSVNNRIQYSFIGVYINRQTKKPKNPFQFS